MTSVWLVLRGYNYEGEDVVEVWPGDLGEAEVRERMLAAFTCGDYMLAHLWTLDGRGGELVRGIDSRDPGVPMTPGQTIHYHHPSWGPSVGTVLVPAGGSVDGRILVQDHAPHGAREWIEAEWVREER